MVTIHHLSDNFREETKKEMKIKRKSLQFLVQDAGSWQFPEKVPYLMVYGAA